MSVVHARRSTEHTAEHACHRKGFQMLKIIAYCTKISKKEAMSSAINNTLIIYFQYNKLECFENTVEPFLEKKNKIQVRHKIQRYSDQKWTDMDRHELGLESVSSSLVRTIRKVTHMVVLLGYLNVLVSLMILSIYVSEGVTWT